MRLESSILFAGALTPCARQAVSSSHQPRTRSLPAHAISQLPKPRSKPGMAKLTSPPVHTQQDAQLDTSTDRLPEGALNGFANAQPSSEYGLAGFGVEPSTPEGRTQQAFSGNARRNEASAPYSVQAAPCVSHIHWHHGKPSVPCFTN